VFHLIIISWPNYTIFATEQFFIWNPRGSSLCKESSNPCYGALPKYRPIISS